MNNDDLIKLRAEMAGIYAEMRKCRDVAPLGTKLISKLKSEMEGRGKVSDDELNKLRKIFNAAAEASK